MPVFGMPVFDGMKDRPGARRIIFEYSRQASMLLDYQTADKTIIFDHLAPRDENVRGQYEFYGPDFSYDGLRLVSGRWRLIEDLPLKNPPSPLDLKFNDPKTTTKGTKRDL
jgi:hypothetical protein